MSRENFWSKIKQGSSSLTQNFGNISIGHDHDGDESYETLVHKSLIKFYEERGGQFPDWLIADDPAFNNAYDRIEATNYSGNAKFYPVGLQQSAGSATSSDSHHGSHHGSGYRPSYSSSHSTSSLPSSSATSQSRMQSVRTQTPASASLHDMYKSNTHGRSSNSSMHSSASPGASNSIRDRLKNSPRGGTSASTANRLQGSWAKR